NLYSSESRFRKIDPGTTYPLSCSCLPSQACRWGSTSSTVLKYSVPSRNVDHSRPTKAAISTALVAPILIYRCVIRTSGKEPHDRIARLPRLMQRLHPSPHFL